MDSGKRERFGGQSVSVIQGRTKQGGVTYSELGRRFEAHALREIEASITSKLARATFLFAVVAALVSAGINLENL